MTIPKIVVDNTAELEQLTPHQDSISPILSTNNDNNQELLSLSRAHGSQSAAGSVYSGISSSMGGSTFVPDEDDEDDVEYSWQPTIEPDISENPFAFFPESLNSFLPVNNPTSLRLFKTMKGLQGLEEGLQTNLKDGLDETENTLPKTVSRKFKREEAISPAEKRMQNRDGTSGFIPTDSPRKKTTPFTIPAIPLQRKKKSLQPDEELGQVLTERQFKDRKRIFGENKLPKKKSKRMYELVWEAYKDPFILVLTAAAVISLALGLYETISITVDSDTPIPVNWVEGVAIVVAIIIVVVVSAGNDWQKERQFAKLNRHKENRFVQVVRGGKVKEISVYDVLVGDVVIISQGDLIPADGIVIESNEIKCDESGDTGELDAIRKMSGSEVYRRIVKAGVNKTSKKLNPFIVSGSKVVEGTGKYLVTAVGPNSLQGKTMISLGQESEKTPLQIKLEKLAGQITKFGVGSAIILLLLLTIKFVASLSGKKALSATEKATEFLDILIVAVTVIVVAVPEGLPLAVTLALAYATTRMLKDKNLVRVLRACETMGNATTICSDKTGTLTENKMAVVSGVIGKDVTFELSTNTPDAVQSVFNELSETSKDIMKESAVLNSTAKDGEFSGTFYGSKTEIALVSMINDYIGKEPLEVVRSKHQVEQIFPFDSDRKCMGVVVKTSSGYRLYVKGASEVLLEKCASYVANAKSSELWLAEMTEEDGGYFSEYIIRYAQRSLRTIALAYRDFSEWPPVGVSTLEEYNDFEAIKVDFRDIFSQMTLFAIVGIKDPLRSGVSEAVSDCAAAGVIVRMVTGDNVETAKAIARECGILSSSRHEFEIMEGPAFRKLQSDTEKMRAAVRDLRVLARSSPEDKKILVKALKDMGETVAVTGDGTNDGPALKMADVGFSMGISGTEVAKEASSIILMDDNFSSIVKAIMWGRAVNDSVQKFLQFQLTVNITAVILTFVSAAASSQMTSVLTAVQLLWVNLIMDTFAALALATDAPRRSILQRPPARKSSPLITLRMWKMIIGQTILQLVITLVLNFAGTRILGYQQYDSSGQITYEYKQLQTMVFNTFVWLQIANEFNNRRLDNGLNIFEGVLQNKFFILINCVMFAGQVAIIFVGGKAFGIVRLNWYQWLICLGLAALSLPWAVVIRRLFPDEWVENIWNVIFVPVGEALGKAYGMVKRQKKGQETETV